jgi:hypothetical protein
LVVKPWAVEKDIFMRAFDYVRPSSFEEACRLLRQSNGQRKALAGGTDLLVQIKQGKLHPKAVVSLRDIPELSFIRPAPERGVSIGAMTPLGVIALPRSVVEPRWAVTFVMLPHRRTPRRFSLLTAPQRSSAGVRPNGRFSWRISLRGQGRRN